MSETETHPMSWRVAVGAALILALFGLLLAAVGAAEPERTPLDRKVRVMERVIDEVLAQSPHVMVNFGSNARGLVLDEFGGLFTFEGSLGAGLDLPGFIVAPGTHLKGEPGAVWLDRERLDADEEDEALDPEEWRRKSSERRQKNLDGLQAELVDVLVDYGATLAELRDDQWVAVAAYLDGSDFFDHDSAGNRVVVKVKMRDLRQHAAGTLNRDAVESRVKVERR